MSDLISRQAAIDAIHNLYAIHGSEGSWIDQKDAFKALNSLPSAEPVRHGKWIRVSPAKIYECSECGQNVCTGDIECYRFCHQCGARMDKDV